MASDLGSSAQSLVSRPHALSHHYCVCTCALTDSTLIRSEPWGQHTHTHTHTLLGFDVFRVHVSC